VSVNPSGKLLASRDRMDAAISPNMTIKCAVRFAAPNAWSRPDAPRDISSWGARRRKRANETVAGIRERRRDRASGLPSGRVGSTGRSIGEPVETGELKRSGVRYGSLLKRDHHFNLQRKLCLDLRRSTSPDVASPLNQLRSPIRSAHSCELRIGVVSSHPMAARAGIRGRGGANGRGAT
jgi:hypothetical protein